MVFIASKYLGVVSYWFLDDLLCSVFTTVSLAILNLVYNISFGGEWSLIYLQINLLNLWVGLDALVEQIDLFYDTTVEL